MEYGITCLSMALSVKKKTQKQKSGLSSMYNTAYSPGLPLLGLLPPKMGLYKTKGVLKQILTDGQQPRPSFTGRIQLCPVPLLPELSRQVKSTTMSLEDVLGIVLSITL